MATRYNAYGWYNPFASSQPPDGLTLGDQLGVQPVGQQPLRGLIVPMTGGPAWVTEPGLSNGFVEVKNEHKVFADQPGATSSTTTTTVVTNGGTNGTTSGGTSGGTSGATTTSEGNLLTSNEKPKYRRLGVALCILSAFTLGLAVAYLAVPYTLSNPNTCPQFNPSSTDPNLFYYWGVRAAVIPLPIFTFVVGILCVVIRDRRGGQAQAIYGLDVFSLILLVPLTLAGGIGGILEATVCVGGTIDAGIIYLVLPAMLLLMCLILSGLLIYLLFQLAVSKKGIVKTVSPTVKPDPPAQPTSTTAITTTTTTTPAAPTPATTTPAATTPAATTPAATIPAVPAVVIPAPPTQPPAVPAQPLVPQQYAPQMPPQPNYYRPPYRPAYRPAYPAIPSPYQQLPPRNPPRPPPMFGASPYRRPPSRSPYGYSPYYRPPRFYGPNPYY